MKIYIDTNVFLNSILDRDHEISKKILYFLADRDFDVILNDISIVNIHYFISKNSTFEQAKRYIKTLLEEYVIIAADSKLLKEAIDSNFVDFEDGVQYFCAKSIDADLIITNDKKGFLSSNIETITSENFYNRYVK